MQGKRQEGQSAPDGARKMGWTDSICGSMSWLGKQKGGTTQLLSSPEAKAAYRAPEAFGAEKAVHVSSKQTGLRLRVHADV